MTSFIRKHRIAAALIAVLILGYVLGAMEWANATPDPDGDGHKVAICHRTASDSNPYVFIEVDEASLSPGHLDNADPGHKPTFWKSDGTFRGVAHVAGDPKDDYLAQSAADCQDGENPPEPEVVVPIVTFIDPDCDDDAAVFAGTRSGDDGITYSIEGDVEPGGTVTVTAVADEGFVIEGQTVFEHTFGDAPKDCDTDEPTPTNPPKDDPTPRHHVGDLAETGVDGRIIWGSLAALALLATGLWALRKANSKDDPYHGNMGGV